jgi:branched-subunit amino acid permease
LLAVAGVALGGLVLVLGSVPILLLIFPLTIGAVGVVFLVGYLRHRARRRRARGG